MATSLARNSGWTYEKAIDRDPLMSVRKDRGRLKPLAFLMATGAEPDIPEGDRMFHAVPASIKHLESSLVNNVRV